MKILIIGSGGREHALGWKLSQSEEKPQLYFAPGNAGTLHLGENIPINVSDFNAIEQFCYVQQIDLVLIGPEKPLVDGITDHLTASEKLQNIKVLGPDKVASQLEGSKDFSKKFMQKYGIPTARATTFSKENIASLKDYLRNHATPIVVKADGLAAGKGVIIAEDFQSAFTETAAMILSDKFGSAGSKVVIEEYLKGIELSMFILTDGDNFVMLPEAKDYKRVGEGDTGPNTGGMGAISPVYFADDDFKEKVIQKVIKPTLQGLKAEGIHYKGFIFLGLMAVQGEPYVIEYNARLGDPETEAIMPRIESDLLPYLIAATEGKLGALPPIKCNDSFAACVMSVSGGYPGKIETGIEITINAGNNPNQLLFHAGTTVKEDSKLVTNGGRVLAGIGLGANLQAALDEAYSIIARIDYHGKYYRRDIGFDLKN
jgi:phosphoribosylamine--glycine ligase